ncbi:lanthionine synthetase LanC family protein [Streptomyces sp. Ag109_O5-10]|uniref:lanthionine synthetase LanC family protein n=1 Tax=Streptomyces sp. Ag109_O5-10 TaxID=1855349 RepID=UPI000894C1AA|nr:lanthionine synthetase LanC family protein [Streptomyces sp. Ag109_O5-10]SEE07914.1 Lanthionine synthetase C-like protein [Streptomyces sp. Ag109_O5-10]
MTTSEVYRELGEAAWTWVLRQVREDEGPWLPETVSQEDTADPAPDEDRDSLYAGIAGLAPVLAEIARYRPLTGPERVLAAGIVNRLAARAPEVTEPSLYLGLAGHATALRLLAPGSEATVLRRLDELATPGGWRTTTAFVPGSDAPLTDVIMGVAGVVMTAVWAGGEYAERIATTGGEALLRMADRTAAGLDWGISPGSESRSPNYSHGAAGVGAALAVAGAAAHREDFVEAAVDAARHVLSVGSLADGGFVVPHTIPPSRREVEPVTYTWCHGPAGTSHLFTALAHAGVDEVAGHAVGELRQRCLTSILASGLPERLRPGFWDNDGRCCGTAGVGDVLLDAAQDCAGTPGADALAKGAVRMGDALVERAVRDAAGARWRFVEYRIESPLLPPGTSWMQGAAGIAAYLLRLARYLDTGPDAPVVDRPDQWWAVPARLRGERPTLVG